jgi:hypothetical protein
MISTRNQTNPLKRKKNKTGQIGYSLGNKLGMGNIKGGKTSLDKLIEPLKRY